MNTKSINWGLAIPCGWFVILVGTVVFLPSADLRQFALRTAPLLVLITAWLVLTVVVLGIYFCRSWERLPSVSTTWVYAVWLTVKTAGCALALVGALVWLFLPNYLTTPRQARELCLKDDLPTMRGLISQ